MDDIQFPDTDDLAEALWRPIFIEPILGSGERITIGVIAANGTECYLARANDLERLRCLYAERRIPIIHTVEDSLAVLSADLAKRGKQALLEPKRTFANIIFGETSQGMGSSVEDIALSWLRTTSSLFSENRIKHELAALSRKMLIGGNQAQEVARDRLPEIVLKYVTNRRPPLERFFADAIRMKSKRYRTKQYAVHIDYSSSVMSANFCTLQVRRPNPSVRTIKERLWDLRVDRDKAANTFVSDRKYELFVQHPSLDDPQYSERHISVVNEAVEELKDQASIEGIQFFSTSMPNAIAETIIEVEGGPKFGSTVTSPLEPLLR